MSKTLAEAHEAKECKEDNWLELSFAANIQQEILGQELCTWIKVCVYDQGKVPGGLCKARGMGNSTC